MALTLAVKNEEESLLKGQLLQCLEECMPMMRLSESLPPAYSSCHLAWPPQLLQGPPSGGDSNQHSLGSLWLSHSASVHHSELQPDASM